MKLPNNSDSSRIADIIESRSPAGQQEIVQGWHQMLKRLLNKLEPYLIEGNLVTFRHLKEQEKTVFDYLHQNISVPLATAAIYMPPSVRHQMMYHRPKGEAQPISEHSPDNPPDKGIVLAGCKKDLSVIVNALLAKPPFTPAIDVYENGKLLAGYTYNTMEECIGEISKVLRIHLQAGSK